MLNVIDQTTLIPLGCALGIIGAIIGATIVISRQAVTLYATLKEMQKEIKQAWTRKDQEIYMLRFRIANPQLKYPELPTQSADDVPGAVHE